MRGKNRLLAILVTIVMMLTVTIPVMGAAEPVGLKVEKYVDREKFADWTSNTEFKGNIDELLAGMVFYLYAVNENDEYGAEEEPVAIGALDASGYITFDPADIPAGRYAIVEELSGVAERVFNGQGPVLIDYYGVNTVGDISSFDRDAFYTIVNGFGGGYVLGYQGLNNTGDIFPIAVKNTDTGKEYPSFCAHGGSTAFAGQSGKGCGGYIVVAQEDMFGEEINDISDFLKAYNYIEDKYGNVDDYRAVTQIITWYLLGAITEFDSIDWTAVENGGKAVAGIEDAKAIVEDVAANYAKFSGEGKIAELVYMVCEEHHDPQDCQPQLVPVYGGKIKDPKFPNTTKPPKEEKEGNDLGLYKRFTWGGSATGIPAGVTFKFELTDPEGNLAASAAYTTTGQESNGGDTYIILDPVEDYEFDVETTYTLSEKIQPLPNWTFDTSEYVVEYWESEWKDDVNWVVYKYKGLQHMPDESNYDKYRWSQDESEYGPVFINRYSFTTRNEPDPGRLVVTKAFNITNIPDTWSALITVTGPGGYNRSERITGANRVVTFENLDPGTYTVAETNPSGVTNYVFVDVEGEGSYNVTRGNTTNVTIRNNYNQEEFFEDEPPPLDEFDEFDEEPPPLAEMPQTGISDTAFRICAYGLCFSLMGVGYLCYAIAGSKKALREGKASR